MSWNGKRMTTPISLDVRKKIIAAYEKGLGTQEEIARIFGTTRRTVTRSVRKANEDNLAPKSPPGRLASIDEEGLLLLKKIVLSKPDKTLSEYCAIFEDEMGIYISLPVMCRALKKLNLRRKKKSFYAQEQDRPDVKKKRRLYGSSRAKKS